MESDLDKLTAISKSHNTSLIFDSVVGGLKGYVISDNIENVMETVSKINLYLSSQNVDLNFIQYIITTSTTQQE